MHVTPNREARQPILVRPHRWLAKGESRAGTDNRINVMTKLDIAPFLPTKCPSNVRVENQNIKKTLIVDVKQ